MERQTVFFISALGGDMFWEFGEATVITVFTDEQPNAFRMLNNNLERGVLT